MWSYVVPWLCVISVQVLAVSNMNETTTTLSSASSSSVDNTTDAVTDITESYVSDITTESATHSESTIQTSTGSALSSTKAVSISLPSTIAPMSTQQNVVSTTTQATFAWNHVAFGLIAVIAVLLIVLIIIVIYTYKLKQKLKQCSKTLYPITPGREGPNEYLDLEAHQDGKHGNVELTKMQMHHEEVFDTPTLPTTPTPPAKPSRLPPPPPPISDLPSQKNLKEGIPVAPMRKIKKNRKDKQVQDGGRSNQGFEPDDIVPGMNANNLYEHDDGLYEEYDEKRHADPNGLPQNTFEHGSDSEDCMEEQLPYEEPMTKFGRQVQFTDGGMNRQDSSTGLPDVPSRFTAGNQHRQTNVPLGMTDEDEFGNTDFDQSGIPLSTMQFDDPQFFDDLDANEPHVNFDMDVAENRDSFVDIPNHHYHTFENNSQDDLNNHQTNDITTQALADDDTSELVPYSNESGEPGLYEVGFTIPKEKVDTADGIVEEEIEYENTTLPAVPPRRDIERKQSESEAAAINLVTTFGDKNQPSPAHSFDDNQPENDVLLRSGKNIRSGEIPRDSYFLDVTDNTIVMKDVHDNLMTGESEMAVASQLDQNAGLKNNDISVNESLSGNLITEMSNLPPGDYMNTGEQPNSEMLVDYENSTNINAAGNPSNFTSDPFDMFNGTIPHDELATNSNGVNYENATGFE